MPDMFVQLLQHPSLEYIAKHSQQTTIPAATTVFRQGDSCNNYLFVLSGSVKVFSRAENGREIILYRVTDGESCTLTTACLFANNLYPAEGITETDTTALVIPKQSFNQGLSQSEEFRKMVFNQYSKRLSDVITLVESLSFNRIDIRLARLLLELGQDNNSIELTHQALASELGSAREVISRQLKEFERQQLVKLQRGSITIINKHGIKLIAEANAT